MRLGGWGESCWHLSPGKTSTSLAGLGPGDALCPLHSPESGAREGQQGARLGGAGGPDCAAQAYPQQLLWEVSTFVDATVHGNEPLSCGLVPHIVVVQARVEHDDREGQHIARV